jgi:hypothetical protein
MTDKDVTRNVRSSGEEGVETPTERHYHSIGQKKTFPFGERYQRSQEKKRILAKFRERERKLREEQLKKGS